VKSETSQSVENGDAKEEGLAAKMRVLQGRGGRVAVVELEAHFQHPLGENLGGLVLGLGLEVVHHERRRRGQRVIQRVYVTAARGRPLSARQRLELQSTLLPELAFRWGTDGWPREPALDESNRESVLPAG